MFTLTDEQKKRAIEWEPTHGCTIKNHGAIGGATTYKFTPTSVGVIQVVTCACGGELDLTEYDLW